MTSNPVTQNSTARPSRTGGHWTSPLRAIQAAIGASINAEPSQACARLVNRFAYEYPQSHASTGTESTSGQRFGRKSSVESTNPTEHAAQKTATARTERSPAGRCRELVRGLAASIRRSTSRLNAIAAERAVAMQ